MSGSIEHQPGTLKSTRSHVVQYMAITNDPTDREDEVLSSGLVPKLYSAYLYNPQARASAVSATRRTDNPKVWDVNVTYSTDAPKEEETSQGNPLGAAVKRSLGSYSLQVPMREDRDGVPVKNAAGIPFDPPPMVELNPWSLTCVRSEPVFNMTLWHSYHDHTNSTTFNGAAEGEVKCKVTVEENYDNGFSYYTVNYTFMHNPLGWNISLVNQGFLELVPGPRIRRITDTNGQEVTQPYPLTDLGQAVPESELDDDPSPVNYLNFRAFDSADFNQLGLL